MDERPLCELTVFYRGVPLGRLDVVEITPDPPAIDPLFPPEIQPQVDLTPRLFTRNFTPLPAFETITASLVQRVNKAREAWRSAVALPRGPASYEPQNVAWGELSAAEDAEIRALEVVGENCELHDDDGMLVPAYIDVDRWGVSATLDEAAVGVMARLRLRRATGTDSSNPPQV